MEQFRIIAIILRQMFKSLAYIIVLAIGVPILIGLAAGIPAGVMLGFVSSTALLQATASPVGVGLDLPPAVILAAMTSFALGMTLAIFEICDTFAKTSERVQQWLEKVEKKMQKVTIIHKYGVISCMFISWIPGLGLYSTPVIAWLFRWNRIPAAIFTVFGFFLVALAFLLLAEGVIQVVL
ncbi:MAG TPA: hypothetical protein VMW63_11045 [Methanoregulaceae archaeon]|nr:hypothetical protein [Methanoregulaceae archaeon]